MYSHVSWRDTPPSFLMVGCIEWHCYFLNISNFNTFYQQKGGALFTIIPPHWLNSHNLNIINWTPNIILQLINVGYFLMLVYHSLLSFHWICPHVSWSTPHVSLLPRLALGRWRGLTEMGISNVEQGGWTYRNKMRRGYHAKEVMMMMMTTMMMRRMRIMTTMKMMMMMMTTMKMMMRRRMRMMMMRMRMRMRMEEEEGWLGGGWGWWGGSWWSGWWGWWGWWGSGWWWWQWWWW